MRCIDHVTIGLAAVAIIGPAVPPARAEPDVAYAPLVMPPSHAVPIEREFTLPAFNSGNPASTFTYHGEDAKRLGRQVLPLAASEVTSATVHESIMLPGTVLYLGVSVDLTLAMRVSRWEPSLCEEPHVLVNLAFDARNDVVKEVKLSFVNGGLAGHRIAHLQLRGRYRRLAQMPATPDTAVEACGKLAGEEGWNWAENAHQFMATERRLAWLTTTLTSAAAVSCQDTANRPCRYTRDELIGIVREKPPIDVRELYVPGEGQFRVYRYHDPVGDGQWADDYSVTIYEPPQQKARVDIRFIRGMRPVS